MKYKAIIFDFDGVLVDSVDIKGRAFAKMYEKYEGNISDEVYKHHMANGGVTRREKFVHYEKLFFDRIIDKTELDALCASFSKMVTDMVVNASWIEGAKDFLDKNYQGTKLYVASATPKEELLHIVNLRGMSHYFSLITGGPEKKSENIRKIMEIEGLVKSDVVMLGDAKTDHDAASINKIDFIGVGKDPYLMSHCVTVIPTLTELEKLVSIGG